MSLHNGTAAETERKRMLEEQGHIILNLGQNQYGDLEDVCCNTIIEVKSSKNPRRKLKKKEKTQMGNLLALRKYRKIRYDIRFHGNNYHAPIWQEEYPEGIVSSFKLKATMNPPSKDLPEINSKRTANKSKGVKNGIHPEKKKNKKKEQTMEKVRK